MRSPMPYGPPTQPVFSSQQVTLWRRIFSPSMAAYVAAGRGRNGAPKQALKVAAGSLPSPRSVPATLAANPASHLVAAHLLAEHGGVCGRRTRQERREDAGESQAMRAVGIGGIARHRGI